MWERSRLGGKRRNVSETTLSGSLESGEVSADPEEVSEINCKRSRMDQTSASSSEYDSDGTFQTESRKRSAKKPKCFSKNAILARRNRIKKKKYLEDLENEVQSLRAENVALRVNVEGYSKDMEVVRKENLYLRNVLASRREISRLLGVIHEKTGLLTSSSTCKNDSDVRQNRAIVKPQPKADNQAVNSGLKKLPIKDPLPLMCPDADPDLIDDETFESPITHKDVPLSGLCHSEDSSVPSNLFSSDDHDYVDFDMDVPEDWLGGDEELPNIGVCLHVAKKKVSLEFCQFCNENASHCWNVDTT